jgi:hypothetical protein
VGPTSGSSSTSQQCRPVDVSRNVPARTTARRGQAPVRRASELRRWSGCYRAASRARAPAPVGGCQRGDWRRGGRWHPLPTVMPWGRQHPSRLLRHRAGGSTPVGAMGPAEHKTGLEARPRLGVTTTTAWRCVRPARGLLARQSQGMA